MRSVHPGVTPQDPKLLSQLQTRHGADLEAKSLAICSGTDMVNINLQHVIFPDVETAKVSAVMLVLHTGAVVICCSCDCQPTC